MAVSSASVALALPSSCDMFQVYNTYKTKNSKLSSATSALISVHYDETSSYFILKNRPDISNCKVLYTVVELYISFMN